MIFRQLIHDDLGCASYLIGDEDAGVAAVVDPMLEIDEYLRLARYLGVRIAHVLETHNHADHVSGHGRLVAATGATVHIHRLAEPAYEHEPFDDGWELRLGALRVRAIHTPGHRPEHVAFALIDERRGDAPWAVLTGDTLFVGDIARPDLAIEKEEGARGIFRSLRERLLTLPDTTEVWPGHIGGSLCGGPTMDLKPSSTIGFERRHQPLLQIEDEDEFVARLTGQLGPQPPNIGTIVDLNRGPLVETADAAPPLSPEQLARAQADGALVVDVRTEAAYDAGHVPGAISITARRGGFGTKLGWVAGADRPVALVGAGDDDARAAAALAGSVGVHRVVGYLAGGFDAWRAERRPVEQVERLTVAELHARWDRDGSGLQVVDVRERDEYEAAHIPGAVHAPYREIAGIPPGVDPARPIAAICGSGQRAAVAAGLLKLHGAEQVLHVVDGGVGDWARQGWPVARDGDET